MWRYHAGETVSQIARPLITDDAKYIRYGTWPILAGLDLHDWHVTAPIEERHRSVEFIALPRDLDARYPSECTIHPILDNHSSHISKGTRDYPATRPNRFKYLGIAENQRDARGPSLEGV